MFVLFAYIVYFALLWMFFVGDEPISIAPQKKHVSHKAPVAILSQAPQQTSASLIPTTPPPVALASSTEVAKDLNRLGIRELRELSKGRVRGFMKLSKNELVQALQY